MTKSSAIIYFERISTTDPRVDTSWPSVTELFTAISRPGPVYVCWRMTGGCGRAWVTKRMRCTVCGKRVESLTR